MRPTTRHWPNWFPALAILAFLATGAPGLAEDGPAVLRIVGTGDSEALLRAAAEPFKTAAPDILLEVPDAVGTTGGIKSVLAGKAELARTARPLRDEEKDQGLLEWTFAETPVVFAVNPSVTGVSGLTSAQVLGVYSGRTKNWQAVGGQPGPIYRVARELPETSRAVLNAAIPGFEALGTAGQAVAYSTPEAVDMVLRNPGTIGYFSLASMAGTGLRPLALDGIPPTPEALAREGKAPRVRLALVYRPPLSPAAARFAAFLESPEGRALLARHGCRPLPGKPAGP